ncbi:hypothetical protein HX857_09525 [Pseudomonas gingeri]|uniref:hypothetical protein n=1 Tax=Pseudomonas gingeri TaxID=117681 RepID=UPI0015BA17CF|nr:hypothetical protein [Pseudomonas gingeri]NWE68946.1 hypothetical protein [Pseudomonas gingeri]
MIVSDKEKYEIWKQAYIAAIGGLSAKSIPDDDVTLRAAKIANKAVADFSHEMSKKSF